MNRFIIILLLMLCAGIACAQPVIKAVEVDPPPIIDGDLSDECWKTAHSRTQYKSQ